MRNNIFKTVAICYLLFMVSISYGQNAKNAEITLTILKDSIEHNSIVTIEFFNPSDQAYYLPLDISMDRHLTFNSEYFSVNSYSLKEIWYDINMKRGNYIVSDVTDCMDPRQSSFSSKSKEKEKDFINVDILLLEPQTYVRIRVPIIYFKKYYYKCSLYYWETEDLLANFQLNYQVTKEKMEQLRAKDTMYSRLNLENKGYVLYTNEIQSNIVPLKISDEMQEFMKDSTFGKSFLEIEKE